MASATSARPPTMETLRPHGSPRLTTMLAVGLSGAAVSPAMGRFRIGPVSMLLAFANVRLGAWIPNPRYAPALAAHGRPLPRPGLGYLLKEFFGIHDPSDLYLYVTDGGHWENTALVELLRTAHHRELVCVDADSGPGNLARSISRAIDLAQLECAATRRAQPRRAARRARPVTRPRLLAALGEPRAGPPHRRRRGADQRALVRQAGADPGHAAAAAGLPRGRPDVPAGQHHQPVLPRARSSRPTATSAATTPARSSPRGRRWPPRSSGTRRSSGSGPRWRSSRPARWPTSPSWSRRSPARSPARSPPSRGCCRSSSR